VATACIGVFAYVCVCMPVLMHVRTLMCCMCGITSKQKRRMQTGWAGIDANCTRGNTCFAQKMGYSLAIGDLVCAPGAAGTRPAEIKKFEGTEFVVVEFISKGSRQVQISQVKPCKDFDWCAGIKLVQLAVGDHVHARFAHGDGGTLWFPGQITKVSPKTFAIQYKDGDSETSVKRQNVRTPADVASSR